MEWIENAGWTGVFGFVVLYTLTCVFFLPGSFLTIGAGAIYGFWFSFPLVVVSSTAGAVVNFLTSRYLAKNWLQHRFANNARFQALENALSTSGWRLVLISRISPIVPHSLVSYAAGLISMPFWQYTMASLIGFLPLSIAYAYAGAVVGRLVRTHAGLAPNDPLTWTLYVAGLLATVVVIVMTTQAAKRAWSACSIPDSRGA